MQTRKPFVLYVLLLVQLFCLVTAHAQTKCEASINGFKVRNVYIEGRQYNAVAWGYKHISESTCLTPVTDINKADAVLELSPLNTAAKDTGEPVSVVCTSTSNSSICTDSSGNSMTASCSGGVCTSSYGPDLGTALAGAFNQWLETRWNMANASLYTIDGKLLWRSTNQKGSWTDQWPDKVREGTNSPPCKQPAAGSFARHRLKTYRLWAAEDCGVVFDPEVSIDLKLEAQKVNAQQQKAMQDEMKANAQEAAAKQAQKN